MVDDDVVTNSTALKTYKCFRNSKKKQPTSTLASRVFFEQIFAQYWMKNWNAEYARGTKDIRKRQAQWHLKSNFMYVS